MSGEMPGEDLPFSGMSVTTASVVSTMAAIDAGADDGEHVPLWNDQVSLREHLIS